MGRLRRDRDIFDGVEPVEPAIRLSQQHEEPSIEEVVGSVVDWLRSAALSDLLADWDLDLADAVGGRAALASLTAGTASWTAGEQIDQVTLDLVRRASPESPLGAALALEALVEDAADFCWDFRRGLPRASLVLIHRFLRRLGHELFDVDVDAQLPNVRCGQTWEGTALAEHRLRLLYGDAAVNGLIAVPANDGAGLSRALGRVGLIDPDLDAFEAVAGDNAVARLAQLNHDDARALADAAALAGLGTRELEERFGQDLVARSRRRHAFGVKALCDLVLLPALPRQSYRERWDASRAAWTSDQTLRIQAGASALGLTTSTRPLNDRFDASIVLGGKGRSPLLRAIYLAVLAENFGVTTGDIWLLGSPREVDSEELRAARSYLSDAAVADEFDLMCAAAEYAFDLDRAEISRADGPKASVCHYANTSGGPRVHVVGATVGSTGGRPNTADTYAALASIAEFQPGQRVLVVTSQIFVPFQGFDAYRMLSIPCGVHVECVGFGPEYAGRTVEPHELLQEVLSGVRSARRLLHSLAVTSRNDEQQPGTEAAEVSNDRPCATLSSAECLAFASNAATIIGEAEAGTAATVAEHLYERARATANQLSAVIRAPGGNEESMVALHQLLRSLASEVSRLAERQTDRVESDRLLAVRGSLDELAASDRGDDDL